MGEQLRLMVQLAAWHRAVDAIEVCYQFQVLENAPGKDLTLRRGQVDSQSGLAHVLERVADSGVKLATEQAAFAVMLTIGCHSFTDPVVSARLQQSLQNVFERRSDGVLDIERFAGIVSERTQRGYAACENARLRINQRSVEI